MRDIDLDLLKHNHVRLYWYGLGFIQLKISHWHRLHFYTDGLGLDAINDDIHNHRYPFKSRILKGKLTASYWTWFDPDEKPATHILKNESCNPSVKDTAPPIPCTVHLMHSSEYLEGARYYLDEHTYHQVTLDCETEVYPKSVAQVITPIGVEPICPFSKTLPEEELWRLMAKML